MSLDDAHTDLRQAVSRLAEHVGYLRATGYVEDSVPSIDARHALGLAMTALDWTEAVLKRRVAGWRPPDGDSTGETATTPQEDEEDEPSERDVLRDVLTGLDSFIELLRTIRLLAHGAPEEDAR